MKRSRPVVGSSTNGSAVIAAIAKRRFPSDARSKASPSSVKGRDIQVAWNSEAQAWPERTAFRHEHVEARRQFWFAPSGHLKTDFPFAHRGAPSHGRTGLTIAVAGRRASHSSPESSDAEIKNFAPAILGRESRGFERLLCLRFDLTGSMWTTLQIQCLRSRSPGGVVVAFWEAEAGGCVDDSTWSPFILSGMN